MADIKIIVACHKPSELPKNKLFMPVQVGSALAANLMDMKHDDTGDNISTKNSSYCELTAQYWAWKNVKADYYGLCHYRRFLCFKPHKNDKRNLRGQIEANALDEYNIKYFGLDDEAYMRKIIEANDVVIGEQQKISKVPTPRGNKNTAYKHWVAHDRTLIMKEDLDAVLKILSEINPTLGREAKEYLNTNEFLGFNCFVMKKELFDQMCEIEFEVLKRLEKQVDTSNYNQQLSRIYGFMGEIISSVFFYHIEKTGKYKVKHVPLVYFNYTDPQPNPEPISGNKTIPILFNQSDDEPFKFATVWQSFLDNLDKNYKYDVFLFSILNPTIKQTYLQMAHEHKNVNLRFIDAETYWDIIKERYFEKIKGLYRGINPKKPTYKQLSILPFVPFLFPQYAKMLVFDHDILFCDSIVPLWESYKHTEHLIAAPYNIFASARINDVYRETAETRIKKMIKDPSNYLAINAAIWNFDKYRQKLNPSKVAKILQYNSSEVKHREEVINIICGGDSEIIDQRWDVFYDSNTYLEGQLPYAPLNNYQELLEARKNPGIVSYMPEDPWWIVEPTELTAIFWPIARRTPFYELYLQKYSKYAIENKTQKEITTKVFPVGRSSRNIATRLLPRGTRRYKAVRKIMNDLNIK